MRSRRISMAAKAVAAAVLLAALTITTPGPSPGAAAEGPPEGAVLFFPRVGEGKGVAFWNGQRGERQTQPLTIPLVGNYDSDGFEEVFGYVPGGAVDLWASPFFHTTSEGPVFDVGVSHSLVSGRYIPLVGDFGGPTAPGGRSIDDILWYAPGRAEDTLWTHRADGVAVKSHPRIDGDYRPVVLEGNGFEPEAILWYAPGMAADSIWDFRGMPAGGHRSYPMRVDGDFQPTSFATDGARLVHWYSARGFDSTWRLDGIDAGGYRFRTLATPQVDGVRRPIALDRGATAGVFLYAPSTPQDLVVSTTDASGTALVATDTFQVWGDYDAVVAGDITSATPGVSDGVDELVFGGGSRAVMWRMPTIGTRVESTYTGLAPYTVPVIVATELPD